MNVFYKSFDLPSPFHQCLKCLQMFFNVFSMSMSVNVLTYHLLFIDVCPICQHQPVLDCHTSLSWHSVLTPGIRYKNFGGRNRTSQTVSFVFPGLLWSIGAIYPLLFFEFLDFLDIFGFFWIFAGSEGPPHENGRNSETKSLKIDPKVPNRPSRKRLQTGHWQNPGSYSKKRIFGPKMAKIRPFWSVTRKRKV